MVDIFIIVVMLFSLFVGFCGLKVGVNLSRAHVHSKIVQQYGFDKCLRKKGK